MSRSDHNAENEKTLRQLHQMKTLCALSDALNHAMSPEDVYREVFDALERVLGVERASILLMDPDGVMRFRAWRRLSDDYRRAVEGHSPWPPGEKSPQPVLIPDVEGEPSLASLAPIIRREGIRALGFIPLIYEGALLGKFMIYYDTPHQFDQDEVRWLQTLAAFVAFRIYRTQAEQKIRRLNRTLGILSSIDRLIVRERDPHRLLNEACRIAVEQGGFLMAWIGLPAPTPGTWRVAAHAGATLDTLVILERMFSDPEQGCVFQTRALETGEPAVCNDIESDPLSAPWREVALQRGYRAMVSLPITTADRTIGVLDLYAAERDAFDEEELELLRDWRPTLASPSKSANASASESVRNRCGADSRESSSLSLWASLCRTCSTIWRELLNSSEMERASRSASSTKSSESCT